MQELVRRPYVICNWNERAFGIVIQLHSDLLRFANEDVDVVLITPQEVLRQKLHDSYGKFFYNVTFHKGDPSDRNVLLNAGIESARAVVVLADWSPGDPAADRAEADAQTLLTYFALKKLRESNGADFRVRLEILEERTRESA